MKVDCILLLVNGENTLFCPYRSSARVYPARKTPVDTQNDKNEYIYAGERIYCFPSFSVRSVEVLDVGLWIVCVPEVIGCCPVVGTTADG